MRAVKVIDRQNIVDAAIQYYGSAASVIDLCIDNDLELDSELTPGMALLLQDAYPDTADSDVADYIQANDIVVVSMNVDGDGNVLGTNDGSIIITNDGNYILA